MESKEKAGSDNPIERSPIRSPEDIDKAVEEIEKDEQLYSIALFDILGFSRFVQNNGTQVVLELYNKLMTLIHRMESKSNGSAAFSGSVVPAPVSEDWKSNQLVVDANGYIRVCHFSDTFIIYTNYLFGGMPFWLRDSYYEAYPLLVGEDNTEFCPLIVQEHHLFLSFLQVCMEFFCEAIKAGIPIRGCISTGMATMNQHQSIFFGRPLVEAARGESAQNCIGVSFGKSFNNYHPVYNRYFIPYWGHIKEGDERAYFLSPMVLDWPRFWRDHYGARDMPIADYIRKMNTKPEFSSYYNHAIAFAEFSERHANWSEEIDRDGMTDIIDFYRRTKAWYDGLSGGSPDLPA